MSSNEKLEKGLGGILAAGVLATSPMSNELKNAFDRAQTVPEYAAPKKVPFDSETLHPDMHPIAFLETSYGKNMNHAPHAKGDFDTAYGPLGFKPSTGFDEFSKNKHLLELYPHLKEKDSFTKEFKENPKFYNLVAGTHWNRLKRNTGSNSGAAFAWRWGLGAYNKATPEARENDDYVKKYTTLTTTTPWKKALSKALSEEHHNYFLPSNKYSTTGVDYTKMSPNIHSENEKSFHQQVINNPRLIKPKGIGNSFDGSGMVGVSKKAIFHTPDGNKWLVKPFYHGEGETPSFEGWTEHTMQNMYHASGMGHLMQESHHTKHHRVGVPAHLSVIKMNPDFETIYDADNNDANFLPNMRKNPKAKSDAKKLFLMDWLTGNVDRHAENLMVHKTSRDLLSIDHGLSFQYSPSDSFSRELRFSPLTHIIGTDHDWKDAFDWWHQNKDSIEDNLNQNMAALQPEYKNFITENFKKRRAHIDQLSEKHNNGTFRPLSED